MGRKIDRRETASTNSPTSNPANTWWPSSITLQQLAICSDLALLLHNTVHLKYVCWTWWRRQNNRRCCNLSLICTGDDLWILLMSAYPRCWGKGGRRARGIRESKSAVVNHWGSKKRS
jgi:hypothetical protein